MRRRFLLWFFCILLCVVLVGCTLPKDSVKLNQDEKKHVSTKKIQYNGWHDYISDDTYVIRSEGFGQHMVEKFNIKTQKITGVCLQNDCRHEGLQFSSYTNLCRIPTGSDLFFIRDKKIYYKYKITSYDEEELQKTGSSHMTHTWILAEYDITTGYYSELLSFNQNDFEQMLNFIHDDEYVYYLRYIAKIQNPQKNEDYALSLCRLSFEKHNQEVMFSLADCCDLLPGVIPDPLAVEDGIIYFTCNQTGQLFKIDLDGQNFSYLIDGKNGFRGLYDAYGTFYREGKIYFTEYAQEEKQEIEAADVLIPYCIDCKTAELSAISNDYVRWIFVCDNSIFYEMAGTQIAEGQYDTVFEDRSEHIIKEISFDGAEINRYTIKVDNTMINGVWGEGNYLFFMTGYRKDYEKQSILDIYSMVLNLEDGSVTEYGRTARGEG